MKRLLPRLCLVAAIAATGALPAVASSPPASSDSAQAAARKSPVKRATARLANKRFTRFTESGMSSYDERLHLCRNKRFVYDTVSSSEFGPTITNRTVGTWRVVSARIRRRVWSARVRGRPDEGGSITIRIRTDGDRTTVDGNTVFVDRSDLC